MTSYTISVQPMNQMSRQEITVNFMRAVERFRKHSSENAKQGNNIRCESLAWAALGEALFWFKAFLEKTKNVKDVNLENIQLIEAFRKVRNSAQHELWFPISTEMRIQENEQVNTWIWGVDKPSKRKGDDVSEIYSNYLAGRPVIDTLDELAQHLWKFRSHRICKEDLSQPGYIVGSPITFDSANEGRQEYE